ncbi:PSII 6.1 kDa protein [Trebouxia sp. C0010 RCD-2024]
MSVDRYGISVPQDLRGVATQPLEEYVHARLLQFVGEPMFAKRMYQTAEGVQRAAREVLTKLSIPAGKSLPDGAAGAYTLLFRHECRSIGCLCPDCELCKQAQHRRCTSCFAPKYLSGDALKAKCGAPIVVELINPATGEVVSSDKVSDIQLEICVMDSRAYAALTPGMETAEELDACTLLVNSQGKELLSPGKNAMYNEEHKIVTPMHNNMAELQVHVAGSSIAMLQGQRPPFRLLVRATGARDGRRLDYVKPAVSDAFVVATQRVKTAQKAEIPHIDEPVSKIENVGVQTQNKLQDIKAAAEQIGVHGLNVVHNCITTVGQFKELVESSETDQPLQETLKKVLNFTSNGWHKAREHAMRAVSTDNRMRAWCADDSLEDGLLFKCYLGRVDLEAPVGILRRTSIELGSGTVSFDVSLLSDLTSYQKSTMTSLQEAARKAWWQPGHPGWCIPWDYDSTAFMRSLAATPNLSQPAPSPKMRISAPVPRNLQSAADGLGSQSGMALQPTLPPSNPSHDRGFRQLSGGDSPTAAASNALAQISAAQLLPRGIHSLYAQNPGALLGSGQAAGMALGSNTHTNLPSGLNASSGPTAMGAARYLAGLGMTTSSGGVGANLPDAEAYAAGFDFGAARNGALEAPRPLLRGGSFSRGFALPMHGPGGFKVNQLPASPFEGARHPSATSASNNSSDAPPASGPFASRLINMSQHSMDTTNSSSGGRQSANQGDQPTAFRGLASSASQKEADRSPHARESPFESLRQQQQQQRDQMSQRLGIMHRGAGHAPPHQAPPPSQAGLPRLTSRDSDPRQLQAHTHFSGLQSQGTDRQPQQPQGLSNYQHHQIQQAYNALMQHKQQLSAEEGSSLGLGPPHPMSEPAYPLQPVPSRPGPNNMLGLPGYRALPSMTSSDYDTIMKLKEQLSGLTSFMQAQRSSEQRSMPGHDSSESQRAGPVSATGLEEKSSGQGQSHLTSGDSKDHAQAARPAAEEGAGPKGGLTTQAAIGRDGKPLLGRISSKVGGLLEELQDMLGALEAVPSAEGEEAGASLAPTPLLPNRASGQEINENGLNGVHKSAFEPVTSSQNKRRKLNPHLSSESDNNTQPTGGDPAEEQQGDHRH